MSVDFGEFHAEFVYITEDGLNGSTVGAIGATITNALHSGADEHIIRALDRTLTRQPDEASSTYLVGAKYDVDIHSPFDVLLYAEGKDRRDSGAFSVVRMATWVRRRKESRAADLIVQNMLPRLIDTALTDIESAGEDEATKAWAVPVARLTRVKDFSDDDEGYVYGHKRDLEELARLEVPQRLGDVLLVVAKLYHRSELSHGGHAVFADIQDGLHDEWI